MARPQTYIGIDGDVFGGMTQMGKIVRDARVFGLIEETETCAGWSGQQFEVLMDKVNENWDKYGCMVSQLPVELRERHQRIYDEAIIIAKQAGWSGEIETDDEI